MTGAGSARMAVSGRKLPLIRRCCILQGGRASWVDSNKSVRQRLHPDEAGCSSSMGTPSTAENSTDAQVPSSPRAFDVLLSPSGPTAASHPQPARVSRSNPSLPDLAMRVPLGTNRWRSLLREQRWQRPRTMAMETAGAGRSSRELRIGTKCLQQVAPRQDWV